MRVILGIGNPGPPYAFTRHNVGWFVVDALANGYAGTWAVGSGPYLEKRVLVGDAPCLLVKPLTYVNRSGEAAAIIRNRHGAIPPDFLIVLDDVHLQPGQLRLRQRGSSGGHKGLESLQESLCTRDVPRLRIGVGAPVRSGALVGHVLSGFTPDEELIVGSVVQDAAVIAEAFGRGGYGEASAAYSQWKARTEKATDSVGPESPAEPL